MNIEQILQTAISKNASDLHLLVGEAPVLRINGELVPIPGLEVVTAQDFETMVISHLAPNQKEILLKEFELDLGINFESHPGGSNPTSLSHSVRFRLNIYKQKGMWAASYRLIPSIIRPFEELGLPLTLKKALDLKQGLVLVTGPTGHGKSTTLASFVNYINQNRAAHVITVEDPIEYVYPKGKSIISQRELNSDTLSWTNALKAALREDPDVVLIGELRDLDTISAAMTIAETGHLVFATLHTNSAPQSVDRVIDVFPERQQPQIRSQLAAVLEVIISQRLVPTISPGRTLAVEIMFGNPAVKSMIREAKTHLIDNTIQTSGELGMMTLESSLAQLVREGRINIETAKNYALRPQLIAKLVGGM